MLFPPRVICYAAMYIIVLDIYGRARSIVLMKIIM